MKHRASLLCILACALCLVIGLTGCTESKEYEPKEMTPTVSSPTIGVDGVLRVGVNANGGAPFVTNGEGNMAGLDIDYAAALADQLGLKLQMVNVGTDYESALANGDVDIVMSLSSSDASGNVWVSGAYIQTGVALFASAGNTTVPTRDNSPVIAAQTSSTSAWAVENAFGDDALVSTSDLMSAFSSVETGAANYVAADAVIGTYAALHQNVNMQPIAIMGATSGYGIGVLASNEELQTVINDAIAAISTNGVSNVVSMKWLDSTLDLSSLPLIELSVALPSMSRAVDSEDVDIDPYESSAGENAVIQGSI